MDTRKTTLIATIAVIALLAVGIGFAYTAYTENNGNDAKVAYVTITQTGTTGYTFADDIKVKLDTYNETDEDTIYYRLHTSQNLTNSTKTYTLATLGTIKLHADIVGTTEHPDLNVSVFGSTNFDATEDWFYIIGSAPTAGAIQVYAIKDTAKTTPTWTTGPDALTITYGSTSYTDKELYVYYGYESTNVVTKAGIDFVDSTVAPKDLTSASLIFMATDE